MGKAFGLGGKSAECGFECALLRLSTKDDHHIAITTTNAIMVNGNTGEVYEGPLTADEYLQVAEIFTEGARGDCSAPSGMIEKLQELLTKSSLTSLESSDATERFIVLLSKSGASVQLQSSLKKKTINKIKKSKQKLPTNKHSARKMCDAQGTLCKHASSVHLAIADFGRGLKEECIAAYRYE